MENAKVISVARNHLRGSLDSSSSWPAMQKLEELRLDRNMLSGPLPGGWSAFQSLHLIDMKVSSIAGQASFSEPCPLSSGLLPLPGCHSRC